MIEFNKKEFLAALLVMGLVFLASFLLGVIFNPLTVSALLAVIIFVWKIKTLWTGIKHYWKLLINKIF